MKLELSIGLEKIGEASGNLAASPQPRSLDINHAKYQQTKTCVKFAFLHQYSKSCLSFNMSALEELKFSQLIIQISSPRSRQDENR
jgi:hypothetical protein